MSSAQPPIPVSAVTLLARSDAELVAATLAPEPAAQFLHAHLAALRAAAAVLEVRGRPSGRSARRPVWEMVAGVAPELERWAAYFAANAPVRAAVEAGREEIVDLDRALAAAAAAEEFQLEVRGLVGLESGQAGLRVRAS